MSRARTIKRAWLQDESLANLSDAARVLSIALICLADDYGNGRAGRTVLAGEVFPGRPLETLDAALQELVSISYVLLYDVNGQRYFAIRTWDQHQRVDRPGAPLVPRPNPDMFIETAEKPLDETSQEIPGESRGTPGNSSATHASPSESGSDPSFLTAPPDQPKPSGSARARRKPGAKSEHVPFAMHDLFAVGEDLVDALAVKFAVTAERIHSGDREFIVFWKRRGDRRKQAGWERAYCSNIERLAKSGVLYLEHKPPVNGSRYQPQGDDAEATRVRRNNLIADAEAGRHGPAMQRWARSGKKLAELADRLENTPAPNVARVAGGIGRSAP